MNPRNYEDSLVLERVAEWSKAAGCKLADCDLRRFESCPSQANGHDEIGRHAKLRTWLYY